MESVFFATVFGRIVSAFILAIVALGLYYSVDIYMLVTRREFWRANIYQVYFTRNDHQPKSDALHFRQIAYRVPLRGLFDNRILFLFLLYAAWKATLQSPVLNFGSWAEDMLKPIRGILVRITAGFELKRAAGYPFREEKYRLCWIIDWAKDKPSYILKGIAIRERDLKDLDIYLAKPPSAGANLELYRKIAEAFRAQPEIFIDAQVVTA